MGFDRINVIKQEIKTVSVLLWLDLMGWVRQDLHSCNLL